MLQGTVAMDVAWHFIQRWNYTRYANGIRPKIPALMPSGRGSVALAWLDRNAFEKLHNTLELEPPPSKDGYVDRFHISAHLGSVVKAKTYANYLSNQVVTNKECGGGKDGGGEGEKNIKNNVATSRLRKVSNRLTSPLCNPTRTPQHQMYGINNLLFTSLHSAPLLRRRKLVSLS